MGELPLLNFMLYKSATPSSAFLRQARRGKLPRFMSP